MHTKAAGLLLFCAALAFGETDRDLHFTHTDAAPSRLQIAAAIRATTDIGYASLIDNDATLSLRGTADQVALSEWLFNELDKPQMPAPNNQDAAVHEYHLQTGPENTVRIFYLSYTTTMQDFQEAATAIRTVADVRRCSTYNAARAVIARSTPDQIALTAWIVRELGKPADQKSDSPEYRLPVSLDASTARGEVATRVFHTSHSETIAELQQIATAIRTISDIRRVFTYNRPRAIVVRATEDQVVLAQWLLAQLDKPALDNKAALPNSGSDVYEYDTPYDPANMVRVFYLPQTTIQDFQKFATRVRTTANVRRVFTYNSPRAMAVRGTIDQIATAERLMKEFGAPKANQ